MGSALARIPSLAPGFSEAHHAALASLEPAPALPVGELLSGVPSSRAYRALLTAFRATGGIARGDDLARLLECLHAGNFISLARLIASGVVFGFTWRESFWIPMFQFDLRDLSVNPLSQRVLGELTGTLSGWPLATWFAQPNTWLDERCPVDLLHSDTAAVLQAARADRFAANG